MATSSLQRDLVGLAAFSRDNVKVGKVKDVVTSHDATCDYVIIGRFLSKDLVVPADIVERPGDRVVVPFSSSFLDSAPAVKVRGTVTPEDCGRLNTFFHT
jgi:ribosomal 30S subunit maturation factor RimM